MEDVRGILIAFFLSWRATATFHSQRGEVISPIRLGPLSVHMLLRVGVIYHYSV